MRSGGGDAGVFQQHLMTFVYNEASYGAVLKSLKADEAVAV